MWRAMDSSDWRAVEQGCSRVAERLDDVLTALYDIGTDHPMLRWSLEIQDFLERVKSLREDATTLAGRASVFALEPRDAVGKPLALALERATGS